MSISNYDEAMWCSKSFLLAADRCMEIKGLPGPVEILIIPAIVCAAFSAEVGLKVLISKHKKSTKFTHDLEKLFNQLPVDVQGRIMSSTMGLIQGVSRDFFDYGLKCSAGLFVNGRYFYEPKSNLEGAGSFVHNFARAVNTEIEALPKIQKKP